MVLVAYRLIYLGSEWRLHREWFECSAMGAAGVFAASLQDLFGASFDVLLYDLTSTYFESDPPFAEGDKRRFGYSRDHRLDCLKW